MAFRLPNDSQHIVLYGKNGSGKTVAGMWHLVQRSFDRMPWVIVDSKRDRLIKRIPRIEQIRHDRKPPEHAGLYVARPGSADDIEPLLRYIADSEEIGLVIDEGYRVPRFSHAFSDIMTQGRSKKTPVIMHTQRPSWINPFVMSEASFHQVFFLTKPEDVKTMQGYCPGMGTLRKDYHSYYYDDAEHELTYLKPVPREAEILERFNTRMPRKVRMWRGILENAPASQAKRRPY